MSREPVRVGMRPDARRRILRNVIVALLVVALVAAGVVVWLQRRSQARRDAETAAARAGCTPVREIEIPVNGHLEPGQGVRYSTSPPAGGPHSPVPLPAGVRAEPFAEEPSGPGETIFQAVHSLEHGYVIVWHKGLDPAARQRLEQAFARERKVIVVPYPALERDGIAMTAWGRLQTCPRTPVEAVRSFTDRYREKTAPENAAP